MRKILPCLMLTVILLPGCAAMQKEFLSPAELGTSTNSTPPFVKQLETAEAINAAIPTPWSTVIGLGFGALATAASAFAAFHAQRANSQTKTDKSAS